MFLMEKPSASWMVLSACSGVRMGAGGISDAGMGSTCGLLSLLSPCCAWVVEMPMSDASSMRFMKVFFYCG